MSYIQNSNNRMTVVTDRAQGVSSLKDGEIEIMVHRTTESDDAKGVNEALYEIDPETGRPLSFMTRHHILFTDQDDSGSLARKLQIRNDRPVQSWFYKSDLRDFSSFVYKASEKVTDTSLLSKNVKVSLMNAELNEHYVTYHNFDSSAYELSICDKENHQGIVFERLCPQCNFTISSIEETTWNTLKFKGGPIKCGDSVKILPMEIKTFKLLGDVGIVRDLPIKNNTRKYDEKSEAMASIVEKSFYKIHRRVIISIYLLIGILLTYFTTNMKPKSFQSRLQARSKLFNIVIVVMWPIFILLHFITPKEHSFVEMKDSEIEL